MAVERIPRCKFTKEFREEAVRMMIEEKISIPEVGRRLQLPRKRLINRSRLSPFNLFRREMLRQQGLIVGFRGSQRQS